MIDLGPSAPLQDTAHRHGPDNPCSRRLLAVFEICASGVDFVPNLNYRRPNAGGVPGVNASHGR
jgi:hypothetical protein